MRLNGGIFFLILVWGCGSIFAQPATIAGNDPDYSGAVIKMTIPGNPFIDLPRVSRTVTCDEGGSFEMSFDLKTGTLVELETGIYQATLYTEPGYSYRVVLPEYHKKEYSQRISPFFQPFRVPLKIQSFSGGGTAGENPVSPDINQGIFRFDSLFFPVNEKVVRNRRAGTETDVDSLIRLLESEFKPDSTLFFREYRRYRYGVLKLNEGRTGLEQISLKYLGPVVREKHPGFMELFRIMYKDFLFYFSETPEGKAISYHINRTHNLDSLRSIILKHPSIWSDTLADMVLLQEFPNVFYNGAYHKEAILQLLDSLAANPSKAEFSVYAQQIRNKLSSLMIGHAPPWFSLPDTDGNEYTLSNSKGKYVYLIFCTPDHYGCMMEYPFLKSYYARHSEYLEIVSVMVAQEESLVADFMKRNDYRWRAIYYGDQDDILRDYQVKAFPTAYLLDRNGNLLLSPAPLPSDGFEQHLFRIMRSRGEI